MRQLLVVGLFHLMFHFYFDFLNRFCCVPRFCHCTGRPQTPRDVSVLSAADRQEQGTTIRQRPSYVSNFDTHYRFTLSFLLLAKSF